MPSKTLMIRKPVYEALRQQKRRGESFSRLLERLLTQPHALESFYAAWGAPHRRASRGSGKRRPSDEGTEL